MKTSIYSLLLSGGLIISMLPQGHAAQTGDNVTFNFKGVYQVSSACTVNNDKVMDIPFGNIAITRIDGQQFSQTIPYSVECQGMPDTTPLELKVSGAVSAFKTSAVATNVDGLGIQIQANGTPVDINKAWSVTLGDLPSIVLTAVPVKEPSVTLTEQAFTGTATLTAEYQ